MTMTAPSALDAYTASAADRPHLGSLAMFSVHALHVPHGRLRGHLDTVGLDPKLAGPVPNDADIFRKVTSAATRTKEPIGDGRYVNILVRALTSDEEIVSKRIVAEIVDEKNRRLSFEEAYDVTFRRANGSILARPLVPVGTYPFADQVVDELKAKYRAQRGTVDANGVRTIINRTLTAAQAILVRPTGGVYFAPKGAARERLVESLKQLAKLLPTVDFYAVPLIDDTEQREMIEKEATRDLVDEIDRTMAELRGELDDDTMTSRKLATITALYRTVSDKADAVSEVIECNLHTVRSRLDAFDDMVQGALRRTSVRKAA